MEIFVDFGLFELLAVAGITVLARAVYSRRATGLLFLLASIALPAASVFAVEGEAARWLCVLTLATALVNAAVVLGAWQRGEIGRRSPPAAGEGGTDREAKKIR